MRIVCLAFLALVCSIAHSRSLVIEDVATLQPPDSSWQYFGRFGVAIDGDQALVSGERFVPNGTGGQRHEGAVFIYQRSGTAWNYAGRLGPIGIITTLKPGLAMKGGVVITIMDRWRIYERINGAYVLQPVTGISPTALEGPDIEIDSGRILAPTKSCGWSAVVMHKVATTWRPESNLIGQSKGCDADVPDTRVDLLNDEAIIYNYADELQPAQARLYRRSPYGWTEVPPYGGNFGGIGTSGIFGPDVALVDQLKLITGPRAFGTYVNFVESQSGSNVFHDVSPLGLQPVDAFLEPSELSGIAIERAGSLIAQRNYSYDRKAYVYHLFHVSGDTPRSSFTAITLQSKTGASLGDKIDVSNGEWVITNGRTPSAGENVVRIFQLPETFEHGAPHYYDFQNAADGATWYSTPGSAYGVWLVGRQGRYRQTDDTGFTASWPANHWSDNTAIQAQLESTGSKPTSWVGLMTRYTDASNYYHMALRPSGAIEINRVQNGTRTMLASVELAPPFGRDHLRFESIGGTHRVFRDGVLVLMVRDHALRAGIAGIVTFDSGVLVDDVAITPTALTTIYANDFSTSDPGPWLGKQGTWQSTGGVFRQTSSTGYARRFIGGLSQEQTIKVRVIPRSFNTPANWVGVMARYWDDRNYLVVQLEGRGIVSLWRRQNGVITRLSADGYVTAPNTPIDLRIQIVDNRTRVYFDQEVFPRLFTDADPGPTNPWNINWLGGRVGLITQNATADFDNFQAYEP